MVRGPKTNLSPDSLEYLANLAGQDEVLAEVERETSQMPRSMMQISPDQGALMELLVRATKATNVLEVGTFTGYSAICLARGVGPEGHLTCLELEQEFADIAQANLARAGVADRVTIRVGPAGDSLDAMPEELELAVVGHRQPCLDSCPVRATPGHGTAKAPRAPRPPRG